MKTVGIYLYTFVLSLWVGGMCLFTFVITPVIFRSYARDAAGDIVGRLFPSYFLFTLFVAGLASLFFVLSAERGSYGYRVSLILLAVAVVIALYVNVRLHPEMKRLKQEAASFEMAAPDNPDRARFRMLHAWSAVLNLAVIADGITLLIIGVGIKK